MQNKFITSLYITLLLLFLASFSILRAQWTTVGTAGFGGPTNSTNQRMVVDQATGAVYVVADERDNSKSSRKLIVRKYFQGTWTQIGSEIITHYQTNPIYLYDIAIHPTTHQPYVAHLKYATTYPSIYRFDGTDWQLVGDPSQMIQPRTNSRWGKLAFTNTGTPIFAYLENASSASTLQVYTYSNNTWNHLNASKPLAYCSHFDMQVNPSTNKITVAYADYDFTTSQIKGIKVVQWTNSNWASIGTYAYANSNNNTGANANMPQLAFTSNGTTYLAYRDDEIGNQISVRKLVSNSWNLVGAAAFSEVFTGWFSITMDRTNSQPVVAYAVSDGTNLRMNVKKYSGSAWVSEGSNFDAGNVSSDIEVEWNSKNNRIYTVYRDMTNGGKTTVMTKCTSYSSSAAVTNVNCNGSSNGAINLSLTNNTSGQTYFTWSNGSHDEDLTNLPAGTYSCSMDDLGCLLTSANYTVTEPSAINASGSINHLSCPGNNNGSISQTVSGGSGSYTYLWSNGATTKNISGLAGGTYTCAITDNSGCSITAEYVVNEPEAIVAVETITDPTCWGNPNGSISQVITGGSGNYTYSWSNGKNTKDVTNLTNGTYTCTITDGLGCSIEKTYSVVQPSRIIVNSDIYQPACYGASSGSISLQVSGGVGSYTYLWNTGATTPDALDIPSGSYNCTILDANGCGVSFGTTLIDPDEITATANITDATNTNNGAIDLVPTGGSGNLSFSWSNGATTEDIEGLDSGAYAVTITDGHMCTASFNYTVNVSTGIHDELLKEMKLYPNPASDFVKINGTELSDFDVNIYDVSGSLVKSVTNVSSQQKIEINELQEGVYFVSISYQKSNRTLKLYVTRR